MSQKGVSPILATVLIVLVVIALAGSFLLYSGRTLTTVTERGAEETERVTGAAQEGIQILSVACGSTDQIAIRNSGSTTYDDADVSVFVNDQLQTGSITWSIQDDGGTTGELDSNEVATTSSVTLNFDDDVRVTTPQGQSDTARCPPQ